MWVCVSVSKSKYIANAICSIDQIWLPIWLESSYFCLQLTTSTIWFIVVWRLDAIMITKIIRAGIKNIL